MGEVGEVRMLGMVGVLLVDVVVCLVVVLDRLAAPHAVTHIVVRPHVELVHGAPVLLHPGTLSVEQRPPVT